MTRRRHARLRNRQAQARAPASRSSRASGVEISCREGMGTLQRPHRRRSWVAWPPQQSAAAVGGRGWGEALWLYFLKSYESRPRFRSFCMSPSSADLLRQVKSEIDEVDPSEVKELLQEGVAIIDIRETEELSSGVLPGAKHVARSYLETRIEGLVPDRSAHIILYCASGNRSAYGARTLRDDLGYEHVESMTGGITLWKDRGYEVTVPRALSVEQR